MKKNYNGKRCQLHIIIIVLAVAVLSLLSWGKFAISMGSENVLINSGQQADKTRNKFSSEDGKISLLFHSMNTAISTADSKWSVFKSSYLSRIDSFVTYYTTGVFSSVQVELGRNNWLFYKSKTDGDPIADYEGTNQFTKKEMDSIAQAALSTQKEMESRGIRFAILVPPNKENIYSEYMPDNYVHSEYSRTDLLIEYLHGTGINIISPKSSLLANHLESQVYYSYDTHWNQLGAYIGVKDTLATWNIVLPELSERTISSKGLKGNYHCCGADDLAIMCGLRSVFDDEIEYEVNGTKLMDWKKYEEEEANNEISHYVNRNAENQGTILLVGDSFRSSMIPSLREVFSNVYVVHRSYYTADMLDEISPDYLLVEYVERHSNEIGSIDDLIM